MIAANFTNAEKLAEVERELMQRQRVYKRLIQQRLLSPDKAGRQMAILMAVAEDYRAKIAQGPLFERVA